eukprot:TRINITY_DN20_c0_g1_i6.p1 TRINITY_DN20_c0_g1~~TRINITY_DN20_c0_g1_i6.p1  ORF type:complete len:1207 (-),score=287.39 TRINITY_DN20_c0_g1_i6:1408-5028(-)
MVPKVQLSPRARGLAVEACVFALFVFCAALIAALVVVDSATSTEMYRSLVDATQNSIDRAAAESASHVGAQLDAMEPISYEFASMLKIALNTPRTPTAAELASYGTVYNTVAKTWMYVSRTNFGGPAQVLYFVDQVNATTFQWQVENYFYRTAGLGPYFKSVFLSLGDTLFMGFMGTRERYGMCFPFVQMQNLSLMFESHPLYTLLAAANNPSRKCVWTDPFRNVLNRRWVVALGAGVYGVPGYSENDCLASAFNIYTAKFLAYADSVSQLLPWDAYVVIAAANGMLLAVPQAGALDWSGNSSSTFNFTTLSVSADFDANTWNIMTNPIYEDIGRAINKTATYPAANAGAGHFVTVRHGSATVRFPFGTGKRVISWDFVPSTRWIVIAVIDQDKALHDQARARLLIIIMSALAGGMVLAAAVAVAVYGAVKLQYVRLSNKISDLNHELELAKNAASQNSFADPDEKAVSALAGGLQRITQTLTEVATSTQPVTAEQALVLQDTIKVLLNRDFTVVQPTTELNDDQEQFILDCGMDVRNHKSRPVTAMATTADPEGIQLGSIHFETDVQVGKWDFDVFQVPEVSGHGVIANVVWAALRDAGLFSSFSLDESKLLRFLSSLDSAYCGRIGAGTGSGVGGEEDAAEETPSAEGEDDNPYHNRTHAADVTQAMHFLLGEVLASSARMRKVITPLDRLACVLACAMHDFKHPGRNNMFLRSAFHPTHVMFLESALERFHAANGCRLLFSTQDCEALHALTRAEQIELHATVYKLVLATDMAKHVEYLDAFKAWSAVQQRGRAAAAAAAAAGVAADAQWGGDSDPVAEVDDKSKLLVLQVLIKAADLSNAFRGWRVCREWTMRVAREFGQQGQHERSLGLAVSKFMDGSVSPQDMQNTFVPLIVVPLLRALDTLFPRLKFLENIAWSNLEHCLVKIPLHPHVLRGVAGLLADREPLLRSPAPTVLLPVAQLDSVALYCSSPPRGEVDVGCTVVPSDGASVRRCPVAEAATPMDGVMGRVKGAPPRPPTVAEARRVPLRRRPPVRFRVEPRLAAATAASPTAAYCLPSSTSPPPSYSPCLPPSGCSSSISSSNNSSSSQSSSPSPSESASGSCESICRKRYSNCCLSTISVRRDDSSRDSVSRSPVCCARARSRGRSSRLYNTPFVYSRTWVSSDVNSDFISCSASTCEASQRSRPALRRDRFSSRAVAYSRV